MDCQGRSFLPEATFQGFWGGLLFEGAEGGAHPASHHMACYLLTLDTHTLSCQVVHSEDEPPVEVALSSQRVVVDIRLLHVLLEPS